MAGSEVEVAEIEEVGEGRFSTQSLISGRRVWKRQGVFPDIVDHISLADAYRDAAAPSEDENGQLSEKDHKSTAGIFGNNSNSDEDTRDIAYSYSRLLQSLKPLPSSNEPVTKRRKLLSGSSQPGVASTKIERARESVPRDSMSTSQFHSTAEVDEIEPQIEVGEIDGPIAAGEDEDEDEENEEAGEEERNEVGEEDLNDPFQSHFVNPDLEFLSEGVKAVKDHKWTTKTPSTLKGLKQQYAVPSPDGRTVQDPSPVRSFESLKPKRRLVAPGRKVWSCLNTAEQEIASAVIMYKDVLFGSRTIENARRLRDVVVLHALNHVFKTRDHVLKNNARLAQDEDGSASEIRDQGFTRPKALFILPTRQACVKYIDSMVELCQPEQQENKSRFVEGFAREDDNSWEDKPRDFQELFGGNDDDMFRIGLKFTRKTLKFFSAFYNSDIILASPLGLRTAIESGGSKNGKDDADADFLSSIETVILDHANALLMQNWQHVEYIISQLNLLPKESHGCNFSRVRHWYLDGEAKYLRQTIVLADFLTPEINSIYTNIMLNVAGKFKYAPVHEGAMIDVSASFPVRVPQTFVRLNAPSPASDADVRFSHFTSTILPVLRKSKQETGTLIFMSSYLDFIRLRNYFSTSTSTDSFSFGAISEYTSVRDVARARSHFLTGRQSVLLYSERAHHFRRYKLRGVKRVVFYSLPDNPIFWSEVVGFLSTEFADERDRGRPTVRALFSRWDVLKLERIVGTSRVGRMVNDKAGDTFEFT